MPYHSHVRILSLASSLLAIVSLSTSGCKSAAEKQSRQILEGHKDDFKKCAMAYKELLDMTTQSIEDMSDSELQMYTARMRDKTVEFESERCMETVLMSVEDESIQAGIDEKTFKKVLGETLDEWHGEWGINTGSE